MKNLLVAFAGIALAMAAPTRAQDSIEDGQVPPGIRTGGDRLTIGAGAAAVPSYVGSDDEIVVPSLVMQGQLSGFSFGLEGTTLYADLIPDSGRPGWKLQAGPQISARLDRTGMVRDPAVKALGKLHTAIEVGGWAGIQRTGVVTSPYDTLSAGIAWEADVAGAHGSYVVSPSLAYATPLSTRDYASLTLGADYVGRGFGDYYYDVDAAGHTASGLAAYAGADRAGWKDWNANLLAAHSLTGNLTHGLLIFATAGYSRLLGPYRRSPIVAVAGSPNQWSGAAGLAFTF